MNCCCGCELWIQRGKRVRGSKVLKVEKQRGNTTAERRASAPLSPLFLLLPRDAGRDCGFKLINRSTLHPFSLYRKIDLIIKISRKINQETIRRW